MKKQMMAAIAALLALVTLFSCGRTKTEETITAEQGLTPEQVSGVWGGELLLTNYLILSPDSTFELLEGTESVLRGGFIIEGDCVVLDGYGTDDPDRFLALRYDAEKDQFFSADDPGSAACLSRTEISSREPEWNTDGWIGKYTSDSAVLSIGPGPSQGVLLAAITPKRGLTRSVSLTIESAATASCGAFTLTLGEGSVELAALSDEFSSLSGEYVKE